MEQFVFGFLRIVDLEQNTTIRANMVDYLMKFFQNVCDYGWLQVKGAHQVLLSSMEEGIVTWANLKQCHKIRKSHLVHANKSTPVTKDTRPQTPSRSQTQTGNRKYTIPCEKYQTNTCGQPGDHHSTSVTHKHSCAYCLYWKKRFFNHGEFECTEKLKSKNGGKI